MKRLIILLTILPLVGCVHGPLSLSVASLDTAEKMLLAAKWLQTLVASDGRDGNDWPPDIS